MRDNSVVTELTRLAVWSSYFSLHSYLNLLVSVFPRNREVLVKVRNAKTLLFGFIEIIFYCD